MADQTQYVASIGPLYNVSLVVVGVAFTAVAWFNSLELLVTIFSSFKRHSAYFWSLLVATLGVICYQSAVFCMIFAPLTNAYGIIASIDIGWTCMVTGQSLVLWSRLHLICHSRWRLRAVLIMIIVNGVLCHGTQTVCSLLAIKNNRLDPTFQPFVYTEKVTLCLFFVQEVIISSLYLWEAARVLRISSAVKHDNKHRRMQNLILANVAILVLDIALLSLEFASLWGIWCTFKGFAYSTKLKIEFAILGQLRGTVTGSASATTMTTTIDPRFQAARGRDEKELGVGLRKEWRLTPLGNQAKCYPQGQQRTSHMETDRRDEIWMSSEYTVSRDARDGVGLVDESAKDRSSHTSMSSDVDFATKGA